MSNKPTQRDFSNYAKDLNSPATLHELYVAGTTVTFDHNNHPPRAFRCDAEGVVQLIDVNNTTVTYNVLQGEQIPFNGILSILPSTAVNLQLWW